MKIFKELKRLGYIHYSATTIEELDDLPLNSAERVSEQALVLRWFREKYNLLCVIFNDDGDIEHDNLRYNWEIRVVTHSFKDMKNEKNACVGDYNYKTYEEAEIECLKQMIEIIKKK